MDNITLLLAELERLHREIYPDGGDKGYVSMEDSIAGGKAVIKWVHALPGLVELAKDYAELVCLEDSGWIDAAMAICGRVLAALRKVVE